MIYLINWHENYIPLNNLIYCLHDYFYNQKCDVTIIKELPLSNDPKDTIIIYLPHIIRLKDKTVQKLKQKIIIINTEPLYVSYKDTTYFKTIKHSITKFNTYQVWDYTYKNINLLKQKNLSNINNKKVEIKYLPSLYNSFLETDFNNYLNKKNPKKDIDVLFFGGLNLRRHIIKQQLIDELPNKNITFVNKKYLKQEKNMQYNLINRSKIVLVIHHYNVDMPIDYYRISTLLANKIFVIHESIQDEDKNSNEYKLLKDMIFCDYENIVKTCKKYLDSEQNERDKIAEKCYNVFKNELCLDKYVKL